MSRKSLKPISLPLDECRRPVPNWAKNRAVALRVVRAISLQASSYEQLKKSVRDWHTACIRGDRNWHFWAKAGTARPVGQTETDHGQRTVARSGSQSPGKWN